MIVDKLIKGLKQMEVDFEELWELKNSEYPEDRDIYHEKVKKINGYIRDLENELEQAIDNLECFEDTYWQERGKG